MSVQTNKFLNKINKLVTGKCSTNGFEFRHVKRELRGVAYNYNAVQEYRGSSVARYENRKKTLE